MQQHIQTIVKHFFQKDHLGDVSEKDLLQFTEDYPYAAIGQLLLATKKQETAKETMDPHAVKTSLYFNNPSWFYWQLQDHGETEEKDFVVPGMGVEPIPEAPVTEPVIEPAPIVSTTGPELTTLHAEATDVESPGARIPVSDSSKEADKETNEEPIPFESYHTIDYFASQGIKLKLEDMPKDKLGQQLKSFTEWLRSMKRIPASAENPGVIDEQVQQNIQLIAEHSVSGKDIVTEAMAEVWIKQGNYRKAIAIYEKLSLQNPIKSPYFADRIQKLKAF